MALELRRRRARRRLAAIAFLSTISLEGTHRGPRQGSNKKCDHNLLSNKESRNKSKHPHRSSHDASPKRVPKSADEHSDSDINSSNRSHKSIGYSQAPKTTRSRLLPPLYEPGGRKERRSRLSSVSSRLSNRSRTRDGSSESIVDSTCSRFGGASGSAGTYSDGRSRSRERVRNKRIILSVGKRGPVAILSSLIRLNQQPAAANKYAPAPSVASGGTTSRPQGRQHPTRTDSTRRGHGYAHSHAKGGTNSGPDGQGSSHHNDQRHYHSDPNDLFALMGLDRPGHQDISYANIFLKPVHSASAVCSFNRQQLQHQQQPGLLSPLVQSTGPQGYALEGGQQVVGEPQQPAPPIPNATMRSKSHYLSVIGFRSRGYCGCFSNRPVAIYDSSSGGLQLSGTQQPGGCGFAETSLLGSCASPQTDAKIDLALQPQQLQHQQLQQQAAYHANLLDDPDLVVGKHSTVLAFPSYITSVIDHVKPTDMKRELNERFRARYPNLQLTLSKLRSIKREMYQIARVDLRMDYLVIAQAYVYFEKLCLKHLITKQNRKLCAGAALLLATKLNDIKGPEQKALIEHIETAFRLKRRDLIAMEFGVIVALDFALHLPPSEVLAHYERLIVEA